MKIFTIYYNLILALYIKKEDCHEQDVLICETSSASLQISNNSPIIFRACVTLDVCKIHPNRMIPEKAGCKPFLLLWFVDWLQYYMNKYCRYHWLSKVKIILFYTTTFSHSVFFIKSQHWTSMRLLISTFSSFNWIYFWLKLKESVIYCFQCKIFLHVLSYRIKSKLLIISLINGDNFDDYNIINKSINYNVAQLFQDVSVKFSVRVALVVKTLWLHFDECLGFG